MQPIDLDNVFSYHPPTGTEQAATYVVIREGGKQLAKLIDQHAPDGPEKTLAIRKVQEAVMWTNAGIACAKPPAPEPVHEHTDGGPFYPGCPVCNPRQGA